MAFMDITGPTHFTPQTGYSVNTAAAASNRNAREHDHIDLNFSVAMYRALGLKCSGVSLEEQLANK